MFFLKKYLDKIPLKWQEELISASHTAVSAMVVELTIQLAQSGNLIPTGKEAFIALVAVVLRAGQKALVAFVLEQVKTNVS